VRSVGSGDIPVADLRSLRSGEAADSSGKAEAGCGFVLALFALPSTATGMSPLLARFHYDLNF
jgi:hypothetical protein